MMPSGNWLHFNVSSQFISFFPTPLLVNSSFSSTAKPVYSFAHFGFEEEILEITRKSEYTQPTPIQAQGVPIIMQGRDVFVIAKTGDV